MTPASASAAALGALGPHGEYHADGVDVLVGGGRMADSHMRPYATAEEIADVAPFLAGDNAANPAGAVLLANSGRFTR